VNSPWCKYLASKTRPRDRTGTQRAYAETAGSSGQVVKLLPPLTISDAELDEGLSVLDKAVHAVC
jgi:4-aminobutyrate aminotransferase-like enzyme